MFTPIYGNSTLIPPHTLFLDRSSCPTPITPPTTPSPPTSPTYPKPATPTCTALINIAKDNAQEPFVCEVSTSTGSEGECDTLVCRLDVRRSSFTVTLELYPRGGRYAASVKVDSTQIDSVLTDTQVTKNDSLSVSMRPGRLMFDFKSPPGNVLGIKVSQLMFEASLRLFSHTDKDFSRPNFKSIIIQLMPTIVSQLSLYYIAGDSYHEKEDTHTD